jgi:acetoin utilization deacetylase AcuC-like enzyme
MPPVMDADIVRSPPQDFSRSVLADPAAACTLGVVPYSVMVRVSHHPDYVLRLPDGHPFPMSKYGRVFELLLERGIVRRERVIEPVEVARQDLARVHTDEYLDRLFAGTLTLAEQRRIGVPWSAFLLRRSRLAVQGTIEAARAALDDGVAANLAGGTHHAFADHGEGFCVLNDVAVAIRRLQHEGRIRRALVVDLDVHQGNGTAALFENDDSVFTFSIHGERNYPARKMRSDLDVALADGVADAGYLDALARHLPAAIKAARADLAFYVAGVDVAAGDRYGRFALSDAGIRARERHVLEGLAAARVPVAVTLAGGYAPTADRTAELHTFVFEAARDLRDGTAQRAATAVRSSETARP